MKNPNGYGSVYKLPGARRKPWVAKCPARQVPGTLGSKQLVIGYYKERKEAMKALAAWHSQEHPVIDVDRADITLSQLHAEWRAVKYKSIGEKTRETYDTAWNYFAPLRDVKVRNLRTAHFQRLIDDADALERSRSALQKIRVLAGMLEGYAMQNDIVNKNYAEFITMPRKEQSEKECFSDLDMKRLEKAAKGGVLYADVILIMCYTGWRIGELLELTPFNYDKANNTLTGGMKTDAGKNRMVPVHPKIAPYLQRWLSHKAGTIFFREDERGGETRRVPVTQAYFRKVWFYPTLEAVGIHKPGERHFTPHATRHTFVSLLHKAGVDKWDIQRLAGHASEVVTNKVYTHVDQEQLQAAISALG